MPRSAKIELTAHCDLSCFFCAAHVRPRARAGMPRPLFERLVRELRVAGVEHLGLFYLGESFECEWLEDAVAFAKRECGFPLVFLTTNGVHATADRVRACIDAGLDSLKFSVNAATAAQFGQVTGAAPDRFAVVVENVRRAREARDAVMAAGGHRCGLYASSLKLASGDGEVPTGVATTLGQWVDEHYELPLFGYERRLPGQAGAVRGGRIRGAPKPVPCWSLFTEAHITHEGRLSACCLDHSPRFDMGDLTQTGFVDAWTGERFRELRAAHLGGTTSTTVCRDCIAYEGPCAA